MDKKELGIYIHIPFCKQKCYYCDFISFANSTCATTTEEQKQYIEALKKEIDLYSLENYNVTTIYIGGGTPSYIDSKYIVELVEKIKNKLKCEGNDNKVSEESSPNYLNQEAEITIEVNPGTVTKQKLQDYKRARNKQTKHRITNNK